MSKIVYVSGHQSHHKTSFSTNKPIYPDVQKQPVTEKRIADPSSCMPKGQCYPVPSFFEYRIKAKENDLQ